MAEISSIQEAYCWNLTKLSDALGLHRDTIRKRIQAAGVVPAGVRNNANIYALKDVARAVFSDLTTGDTQDPDQMLPTDRKAWFQSETERVKLEKELRQLIPADEAHREMAVLAKAVANGLDVIPDMLERDCGLNADAVMRVCDSIDVIRQQLYEAIINAEPDDQDMTMDG
jgi:hypothetical protein